MVQQVETPNDSAILGFFLPVSKATATKPYGHVAYTRRTKSGKLAHVEARGAKPLDMPEGMSRKRRTPKDLDLPPPPPGSDAPVLGRKPRPKRGKPVKTKQKQAKPPAEPKPKKEKKQEVEHRGPTETVTPDNPYGLSTEVRAAKTIEDIQRISGKDTPGECIKNILGHLDIDKLPAGEAVRWDTVKFNLDQEDLDNVAVVTWLNPKNKGQRGYTDVHKKRQAAYKFERVKYLDPLADAAIESFHKTMVNDQAPSRMRDAGATMFVISKTGLRPGSESQLKESGHYGVTTLRRKHVSLLSDDKVRFRFIGKSGEENVATIKDPDFYAYMEQRLEGKKASERVFESRESDLPIVMQAAGLKSSVPGIPSPDDKLKAKDFRTLLACRTAVVELEKRTRGLKGLRNNPKKFESAVKKRLGEVNEIIQKLLNHKTKAQSKANYINPAIVHAWLESVGSSTDLWVVKAGGLWERAMKITLPRADEPYTEPPEDETDDDYDDTYPLPGVLLTKSLITDDPLRATEDMHITHVKDGKPVRSREQHQASDDYDLNGWRQDIMSLLLEHAGEHAGLEGDMFQWLADRGLRLPDRQDVVTRRTANTWLRTYGPTAFALGIKLKNCSGSTIACSQELPPAGPVFGFVKSSWHPDLQKARTKGAGQKGATPVPGRRYTGKNGAFLLPGDQIEYLRATEVASPVKVEKKRLALIKKHGSAQFLPPTVVGTFTEAQIKKMWKRFDLDEPVFKKQQRKMPSDPEKVGSAVEMELATQKQGGGQDLIKILQERVATWKKPRKFTKIHDPLDEKEWAELKRLQRQYEQQFRVAGALRGKPLRAAEKRKLPGYAKVIGNIKRIESKAIATEESRQKLTAGAVPVQTPTGEVQAQVFDPLAHKDLGFDPFEKPVGYLLSVGWHNQEKYHEGIVEKTRNIFNDNESDALEAEFAGAISRGAYQAATYVAPEDDRAAVKEGTQKLLTEVLKHVKAEGNKWLLEQAREYVPTETPSAGHNFARKVYASLPSVLRGAAVNYVNSKRRGAGLPDQLYGESLEEMAEGAGGKKFTPATRPETPYGAYHRTELRAQVSEILSNILSPVEWLVVKNRLNVHDTRGAPRENVYGGHATESIRGEPVYMDTDTMGGVKGWKEVKEDVVAALGETLPPEEADKERSVLGRASLKNKDHLFEKIFNGAMDKLKAHFKEDVEQFGGEHKRIVTEYISTQKRIMEGIRHATWDPSQAVKVTTVAAVDFSDITELEKQHQALTGKIINATGTEREELIKQRRELAETLKEKRSYRAYEKAKQVGKASRKKLYTYADAKVFKFWREFKPLGKNLGINMDFLTATVTPNTEIPDSIADNLDKASAYLRVVNKLLTIPDSDLKAELKTAPTVSSGTTLRIQPDYWKIIAAFVRAKRADKDLSEFRTKDFEKQEKFAERSKARLRRKRRKAGVQKSLVILDVGRAIDDLMEELAVWELNGY